MMSEFVETAFSPTAIPATVLLLVVALYWFVAVVGGIGLDFLDFDFDFDADFDANTSIDSILSAGAITLRFLNIGQLPINIWISVFAIAFWLLAVMWRSPDELTTALAIVGVIVRNGVIALIPTKLITQPLRGKFDPVEPERAENLIDRVGNVTTVEINREGGQARFAHDASPLLLNVRTAQAVLSKGEQVRIIDYDPAKNIYTVEKVSQKDPEE